MQEYKEVKKQLFLILDQKEISWRKLSKHLWLQGGNKNTKYFHTAYNTRQRTNRIQKLKNERGECVNWKTSLQPLITNYYTDLFTSSGTNCDEVINCVPQTLSQVQNQDLCKEVTREEVKTILFQMHPDKTRKSDDMTSTFY